MRKQAAARSLRQFLSDPTTSLPTPAGLEDAAQEVFALHQRHGGATFSLYFGNVAGQKLYAVSLYPERSGRIRAEYLTPQRLHSFLLANSDLLADPRCCLGTWLDEGIVYVDISVTLEDVEDAIALGSEYNQIAVYSLWEDKVIAAGGTGEPVFEPTPEANRLPQLSRGR